ncbi:DNA glycosylase [Caballeronia sordidicola]|uniref:Type-4 uracil-DNA glycosylase n=2 Tax=Caballeronia sordidicola TaxID=196367 RepID=A0A158G2U2_CABSO|nr:DNA glycosylase [Caballeronia sordidicola]
MRMRSIVIDGEYATWRTAALSALAENLPPDVIEWREVNDNASSDPSLFDEEQPANLSGDAPALSISKTFAALLKEAALFRDPDRWAFLYKLIWRWAQGDRAVESAADEDGVRLHKMAKAVRRAKHDMIAYVRFRKRDPALGAPEYVAWYEPDHDVLAWGADHFAARMGRSSWMITTPHGAAMWNGTALRIERRPALAADHLPENEDDAENLWLTYYKSTFNPARLNETALQQHMPVRFWKGLPEGPLIPHMISEARSGARKVAQASAVGAMSLTSGKAIVMEADKAQPARNATTSLDACRRCELWRQATQAVQGEGPAQAAIMLVGEQPGDQEDLKGRPFVGPAGALLDSAMQRAGLDRAGVYMTNAVKHFKWEPRGKRRLHKTPAQREVDACSVWLEQELAAIKPRVIVALGATALHSLLGRQASLGNHLDKTLAFNGGWLVTTYHPSFALRQQDEAARDRAIYMIVSALERAQKLAASEQPS